MKQKQKSLIKVGLLYQQSRTFGKFNKTFFNFPKVF